MTDDDVPAWAKPLEAGPIAVDHDTRDDALTDELRDRYAALLQLYNCEPTPAGWRALSLRLALEYHPAFRTTMPISTKSRGGRPSIVNHDVIYDNLVKIRKNFSLSNIQACSQYRKSMSNRKQKPSIKTLQNILTAGDKGELSPGGLFADINHSLRMQRSAREAAHRLEAEYTNPASFR